VTLLAVVGIGLAAPPQLSDDANEALLQSRADPTTAGLPNIGLQAYGGAIAEVPDQETAFAFRDTAFEYVASSRWTDRAEDTRIALARRTAAALDPFARGQYVNTLSDEGAEGVRRAYPPDKLARLTALKDQYDPENVLHLNHNIRPSGHRNRLPL
jgi:hypothetical protein